MRQSIKIKGNSKKLEKETLDDEDQSNDGIASDASDGSEYGVKPRKKVKIKKRVNVSVKKKADQQVTPSAPWKYDPSKPSLTGLPYEVLLFHVLPKLFHVSTVFNLFMTSKLFREMIGLPMPADHGKWKLSIGNVHALLVGTADRWIQGIQMIALLYQIPRQKGCSSCGDSHTGWTWEFRARLCRDCLPKHTISAYYLECNWGLDKSEFEHLPNVPIRYIRKKHRRSLHPHANETKIYLINHINPIIREHYKLEGNESLYRHHELRRDVRKAQGKRSGRME